MLNSTPVAYVPALKDEYQQQPIPSAWRPLFRAIVAAFAKGDFVLHGGIPSVESISPALADIIKGNIDAYRASLIELPDQAWSTSVCMWYGNYWGALVDLWTHEEGPSDLVLHSRVTESGDGYLMEVTGVYVP